VAFDSRVLNGLSVFVAVVDCGSYSRAGAAIGLTKSGVSRAITRLEDRTGLKLFDRNSRSLKLTAEGRLFHEQMAPLLEQIGVIAGNSGPKASTVRGKLRISADAAFGHYLLAPRLGEFLRRFPELQIELVIRDRIGDLIADGFDLAVRFGEPENRDVERRLLLKSRVLTCASKDFLSRVGYPKKPEDLRGSRFETIRLIHDVTGKPHIWHLCKGDALHNIEPGGQLVVNDADSVLATTLAGVGISRPLDFMVKDYIECGDLVEVLPEWNQTFWPAYVYYPARAHSSAGLRSFVEFVGDLVHADPETLIDGLPPNSE
jgi:DNA-binding transcriptional LysR family regulator